MQVLPATPESIEIALEVLRRDGIIVHATETCYGVACDLMHPGAVARLFAMKARPPESPVSALFPSAEAATAFVEISPTAKALIEKHLPGPLTIVLPKKSGASKLWVTAVHHGTDPMIGLRISPHPIALALAKGFGFPIATTSANVHSLPPAYSVPDLQKQLEGSALLPDVILDSGPLPHAAPSTVVSVVGDTVTVLRKGDVVV